ncbi:putative porin [Fodinibius halophilus]|uniref:Putative porin n=1 Tax=Fodinibius halophilus TaxID=1736908 RepID=A0A6M1TIS7_9BACT|nr:putative porin [Fodinibius halophilus]NGP89952.1 putative porin [Fodinibius halophilus]
MRTIRFTYITLILVLGAFNFAIGQTNTLTTNLTNIDSVAIDSTVLQLAPVRGTTDTAAKNKKEPFTVQPWEFRAPIGATVTETDSTLRWQIWPDWTYKLNRDPGVISYRMGTGIRTNAVQHNAHEPRHQQLYWEGVLLNDPVSGALNWSLIPQHKIGTVYQQDLGTQNRKTYYLRQYYLNKPLSRLIYSESKFSKRDLEFEVSHNISRRMNVELSYWDRRTGGEYPNSKITGRQIFSKVSYHLSEDRYLKLNYVNNNYDIGMPFGYGISDLRLFNFDRFSATATQNSASSTNKSSLLSLNFYQRKADSSVTKDNLRAGIYYRGNERSLSQNTDTTSYKVSSVGAMAKKWWTLGGFTLETSADIKQFFNKSSNEGSLTASNWTLLNTEGRISLDFTPLIDLKGGGNFKVRSDGFQSYRLNASSDISLAGITLTPGASSGTVMPTPQQLYWSSKSYEGNSGLKSEKVQEVRGTLSYQFNPETQIGVRGQYKDITDGIMAVDSTFTNVGGYSSQSATFFFNWDLTHFEFNGSATIHRFADSYLKPDNKIPMNPSERVWLKGGAYWKGYLFDRATYVKAGVSGMMAPFRYQADHYNPELDSWQPVSQDQLLPIFNRLDVDVTARVRSIMFLLRWQNVLDDVSQLGYFETAQYPMSQRRFIFGVRALFRN